MDWITDWREIQDGSSYVVRPINASDDGSLHLGGAATVSLGWQVKRLMERCYAALPLPAFKGLPPKTGG